MFWETVIDQTLTAINVHLFILGIDHPGRTGFVFGQDFLDTLYLLEY